MCPLMWNTGVSSVKTDDIVIREVDFTNFEDMFFISTNHTEFGYDCYQNEGKPFGLFYTHGGSELFEGKLRFVFMQGNQIVEKFQPIDIKVQGDWDGKKIQCYVCLLYTSPSPRD